MQLGADRERGGMEWTGFWVQRCRQGSLSYADVEEAEGVRV